MLSLTTQTSGTSSRLQAISAVDDEVAWASGLDGTVVRTTDGGDTWLSYAVTGADSLQFRDVDAFDVNTAYLLSAGAGELSRIYKTIDQGQNWSLQFTNAEPDGFFDCMAFWDRESGLAFSDAVNGEFIIIRTTDGETWQRIPPERVPDALPGEGSFAASGTCLVTHGDSTAWFGTGASGTARVFRTTDRGNTWSVTSTPIISGDMAGIGSLAFVDARRGTAAGGYMTGSDTHSDNVASTVDGGLSWILAGRPVFTGGVYGLAVAGTENDRILIAVGPGGMDYSLNEGMAWYSLDTLAYWSVGFASPNTGWAVGPEGRIVRLDVTPRREQ
ncbi:MAG: glycosyl hydrolase [Gemmatimonadota bacterium]|nr:MAG: glycosyl hydrolase [Gemmatimonadota bacterium]